MGADEVDDLAIALGGALVIAARLVDHPEPIVQAGFRQPADCVSA
jgi:hypothetical protein